MSSSPFFMLKMRKTKIPPYKGGIKGGVFISLSELGFTRFKDYHDYY